MEIDIITKENEEIQKAFKQIIEMKKQIKLIQQNTRPLFEGERYLAELSVKISISRSTLQTWRNSGVIGYVKIGGKVLYKESDIENLLKENYNASL